jgi:hypothetical protein
MIPFLATTTWQASAVIAAALLGIVCFRHGSAAARHWIVLLGLLLACVVGRLPLLTPTSARALWRVTSREAAISASGASDAVGQWLFSNTWLNCEAVDVDMQVTVNFAVTP